MSESSRKSLNDDTKHAADILDKHDNFVREGQSNGVDEEAPPEEDIPDLPENAIARGIQCLLLPFFYK